LCKIVQICAKFSAGNRNAKKTGELFAALFFRRSGKRWKFVKNRVAIAERKWIDYEDDDEEEDD